MAFEETKSFVVSKTLQGLLLVAIAVGLKALEMRGITFLGSSDDMLQLILQVVGIIYAAMGRFKANTKLG